MKQKIIIQNEWSVPYNKVLDRTPLHIRKKWEILQNNNDNGSPVVIMCIEWKKNYYLLNFFLDNGLKKTTTTTFIFFLVGVSPPQGKQMSIFALISTTMLHTYILTIIYF